jgi:type I restriction enzyme S subunit
MHILKCSGEQAKQTTGLDAITFQDLADITVPIPPLPIQKRIAEILDAADALKRKDQELLKRYDELAQAIFIDMFDDPLKNERGWENACLGDLGNWKSGGTPLRSNTAFFNGKIPWLSSGELNDVYISSSKEHINQDAINNSSASLVSSGSLLLGMYDTAALKSSINLVPLCCNQAIAFSKLNHDLCNTLFVYYVIQLCRDDLKKGQRGVRQKNLNLTMIKELEIILPPKNIQDQFVARLELIYEMKKLSQSDSTENLFSTLIHKAFKEELIEEDVTAERMGM